MSLEELADKLRQLSREDKFRALYLLVTELARSEGISLPTGNIDEDDDPNYSADMVYALQQMIDADSDDMPTTEDDNNEDE